MPTEAAMEAARGMATSHCGRFSAHCITPETVAAHLDRVDAVVREYIAHVHLCGGLVGENDALRTLLLPEPKPDAVKVLAEATGLSPYLAGIALDRLHAAGGRIVFDNAGGNDGK